MADKRRFLMYFSYIGTNFRGSQYQHCKKSGVTEPTIQKSVEDGLKLILELEGERPIIVHFCSRTDSGVHAIKAALHVDIPFHKRKFLHPKWIQSSLNSYFKNSCDIRILEVLQVPDSFKFKEACLSKTYMYRIGVLKEKYAPFKKPKKSSLTKVVPISEINRTYFIQGAGLDMKRAEEATQLFLGEKNFAAVGKKSGDNRSPICNILSFTIQNAEPQIPMDYGNEKFLYYHFICTGTRFLYCMVRAMVGVVLSFGRGKTSPDDIRMLFEKPEPGSVLQRIAIVPACGLYLLDTTLDPQKLIVEETKSDDLCENVTKERLSLPEAA